MNYIGISEKYLKQFVNFWNLKFPVDTWWRQKHNISFNSSLHCQSNFIDQFLEFIEEQSFKKVALNSIDKKEKYEPGKGNWLKKKVYSQKEIEDMFEKIDLDKV